MQPIRIIVLGALAAIACATVDTGPPKLAIRYERIPLPAARPEDGALQRVWLFGADRSTCVLVYERALVFPNGQRIRLGKIDDSVRRAQRFDRGVVTLTQHWEGGVANGSFQYVDLEGRPGAQGGAGTGSYVTEGGVLVWSDQWEGYGEEFGLILPDGRRLPPTRPYRRGFSGIYADGSGGRLVVFVQPSEPEDGDGRLYLYDPSGKALLEREVAYETPTRPTSTDLLGVSERHILLLHNTNLERRSVFGVEVLGADGERLHSLEGVSHGVAVHGDALLNRRFHELARVELTDGKTSWSVPYEEFYSRPRLEGLPDRPDTPVLHARRHLFGMLRNGEVAAFVIDQYVPGTVTRRMQYGEDELLFVAAQTGDVLARFALAPRPKVLEFEAADDRLYVLRDGEYGAYVLE